MRPQPKAKIQNLVAVVSKFSSVGYGLAILKLIYVSNITSAEGQI